MRKEKDELAGKFRFGKTILVTDLVYKCDSNAKGTTNIQYGLDELGYTATVIDINSFRSVTRAQKFLDAVDHLKKDVMPDLAAEENVTINFWVSFAFLITDTHPYHVWVEGNFAERFAEAIRSVDWRQDPSLCCSARTPDFMVSDQASRTSPWTQRTS